MGLTSVAASAAASAISASVSALPVEQRFGLLQSKRRGRDGTHRDAIAAVCFDQRTADGGEIHFVAAGDLAEYALGACQIRHADARDEFAGI